MMLTHTLPPATSSEAFFLIQSCPKDSHVHTYTYASVFAQMLE